MHALPPPGRFHGHHAIVIGASMAGLAAARVLAAHFDRVTVYDRDALPSGVAHRRGVPQGKHGHGLLASGLHGLKTLFPDLERELIAGGAVPGDVIGSVRWFQHGHLKARFHSGLDGLLLSRPLLEVSVRRQVEQLPNVSIIANARVVGLLSDRNMVHGVRVRRLGDPESTVVGDLVVDCSGRGSHVPEWLGAMGYAKPPVDEVFVGLGYTTRVFRRLPGDLGGDRGIIVAPTPPREMRLGFMLAMEGNQWIVGLGGWLGNHAPSDLPGFIDFARSLPCQDIHEIVSHADPLGEVSTYGFPASYRRRYESCAAFPSGLLVLGDALCSVNPIYGQGMSLAVLQALALRDALESPVPLEKVWRPFFASAAEVIDRAWTIAVGADFAFRGVTGPHPASVTLVNWYMSFVHRAAAVDHVVCRTFFDVANLLAPASSLLRPSVMARVARACLLPAKPQRRPAGRDTERRQAIKTA